MLILLRHGQTPHNAEALLQGSVDSPLDDVGIIQAKKAGEYISSRWMIDDIVSSPLLRTRETVEHAGFEASRITVDERWREIDFGDYDGRPVRETIGELGARWKADPGYRPPGGESMTALHDRVAAACADLVEGASERNVLVVTHATPIKAAAVWALEGPISMILNMWVGLASITVFGEVRGDFQLRELNTLVDLD